MQNIDMMIREKLFMLIVVQLCLVAFMNVASEELTCKVDSQTYKENETFSSGVNGCAQCVCSNCKVSCDIKKCQKKHLLTAPAISTHAKPSHGFTSLGSSLSSSSREDLDSIAAVMMSRENPWWYWSVPLGRLSITLTSLHEKRFIQRAEKLNKIITYSTDTYVINHSSVQQTQKTIERSFEITTSEEASVEKASSVSFSAGVEFFGFSTGVGYESTESDTLTKSKSQTQTVTAPSQEIAVPPKSQIKVTYNVYEYVDINDYYLDFEVDENASILEVVKKQPLSEYSFRFKLAGPIGEAPHLSLKYVNETFVLCNFPTKQKLTNYGIDVIVHPEEAV